MKVPEHRPATLHGMNKLVLVAAAVALLALGTVG